MVMDTLPGLLAERFAAMGQFADMTFCAAYERAAKPEPLRQMLAVFDVARVKLDARTAVTELTMTLHAPKQTGSTAIRSRLAALLAALLTLVTPDDGVTVGPIRYDRAQDTLHVTSAFTVTETRGA